MWSCQQNMMAADLEDWLREHLLIPRVWLQVLEDSISETPWLLLFMLNIVSNYSLPSLCFCLPLNIFQFIGMCPLGRVWQGTSRESITTLILDTVSLNVASYHISPFRRQLTHRQLPSFIVSHAGHLKIHSALSWTDAVCLWPCLISSW